MTKAERDRLGVLRKAKRGLITQREAAVELDVSIRHVKRLVRGLKEQGDKCVIHGLRGRPSPRRIGEDERRHAVEILSTEVYRGFGPTLACEYLSNRHDIHVSKETVRKWMIEAGLWRGKRRRMETVHPWRPRRSRCGELVQWDTSDHDWLEGRGPRIYLVSMIDDATSRLHARFVARDSTTENMRVLWAYLQRYGRPLAFYTDKASLFQTAERRKREEPGVEKDPVEMPPTQIGRALQELSIAWIPAHSPQAKGRVERGFLTAQDRLVKGLRVAGASTLEQANEYLEREYVAWWNANRTVHPAHDSDAHRSLERTQELAAILSHVEQRQVDNGYILQLDGKFYRIDRRDIRTGLRKAHVRVEARLDGSVAVRFNNAYLRVERCEKPTPVNSVSGPVSAQPRRAPNAGGKSAWMKTFWDRPSPTLRQAVAIANATS